MLTEKGTERHTTLLRTNGQAGSNRRSAIIYGLQGLPMKIGISFVAAFVGMLLTATYVNAQGQARQYPAPRPTVSPYLNLLRGNAGPVPNYYSLVRPQLQQQRINQQQQSINLRQQSLAQANQQGIQSVQQGLLEIRQPQASPTGTGGGFMNFSHFYSFSGTPGLRR